MVSFRNGLFCFNLLSFQWPQPLSRQPDSPNEWWVCRSLQPEVVTLTLRLIVHLLCAYLYTIHCNNNWWLPTIKIKIDLRYLLFAAFREVLGPGHSQKRGHDHDQKDLSEKWANFLVSYNLGCTLPKQDPLADIYSGRWPFIERSSCHTVIRVLEIPLIIERAFLLLMERNVCSPSSERLNATQNHTQNGIIQTTTRCSFHSPLDLLPFFSSTLHWWWWWCFISHTLQPFQICQEWRSWA